MKIVLLTSDSCWQRALAQQFDNLVGVTLAGIVVQEMPTTFNGVWILKNIFKQPQQVASKIWQRLRYKQVLMEIDAEAIRRFGIDGKARPWPDVAITHTENINSEDVVHFIKGLAPDVICVSGTKIVKQPVFDIAPPMGLLNLHTGISPFYKGGPNCTLWCLANHQPQFIGSTLHSLDPGIDTGEIFITEQSSIEADDTAATLVSKAIETGHGLYLKVLQSMSEGVLLTPVPQNRVGSGRTYMTREWNVWQLKRALSYVKSGSLKKWVREGKLESNQVELVNVLKIIE